MSDNQNFTPGCIDIDENKSTSDFQSFTPDINDENKSFSEPINDDISYSRIICQDHSSKLNSDKDAERYCLQCKYALCSFCVVEYHSLHIADAKIKISDFLKEKKEEVEKLNSKIIRNNENKKIIADIFDLIESNNNEMETQFQKIKLKIEEIKNFLDKIIILESRIIDDLKQKSKTYYQNLYNVNLKEFIDISDDLSLKIINLFNSWDKINDNKKLEIIKKNQISKLDEDYNKNKMNFLFEADSVKAKILNLLGHNKKFREEYEAKTSSLSLELEAKNNFNYLKEKYDYLQKTDVQNLLKSKKNFHDDFDIIQKTDFEKIEDFSNNNLKSFIEMNSLSNKLNFDNFRNFNAHKKEYNIDNTSNFLKDKNIFKSESNHINDFKYEFLIGIQPNQNQIKIFETGCLKPITFHLDVLMFQDPRWTFDKFPNHCKFVNLGFSILVTGGLSTDSVAISSCFLIVLSKQNPHSFLKNNYDISISPYSCMLQARDRHCLIYLQDKNKILACCGFSKNSAEITSIETGEWKKIESLNENRANASSAYVDNRYVWIFGGYKLKHDNIGVYLNSAEVFDSNDKDSKWNLIDFDKFCNSIKFTAAGVIYTNEKKILLCGGYDGSIYLKDIYCLDYCENQILSYEKSQLFLPNETIFFHSNFINSGQYALNYDYKLDLYIFNPVTQEFKIIN